MLTHNALADLSGPHFLLLYAVVIALTLAYCAWSRSRLDATTTDRLPLVPTHPDPFEIAYLRGGANEVTRVAVFDLIQRGFLEARPDKPGKKTSAQKLVPAEQAPDPSFLSPLERDVLGYFTVPRSARDIFQSALPARLAPYCAGYDQALRAEGLLSGDEGKADLTRAGLTSAAIILGFGGYKLVAALVNGYSNVGFLILLALASLVPLAFLCQPRRLTRRGRAYLQRLQQAFERLKRLDLGQNVDADPAVLLVSVFGVGALAGTPHAYYGQMFAQSSGGGCGGSSGGCGGGGGGGCGGGCGGCGGG